MRRSKSFPFIKQSGMMECGPACLAMIFKSYGYYNITGLISQMTETTTEGTSLFHLGEVAEQFGFHTEAYEMTFDNFKDVSLPAIIHWEGNHFMVVYKVSPTHVWIANPAYGKDKMTREEFVSNWNGIILTVEPTPEIFKNKDLEDAVQEYRKRRKGIYGNFYRPALIALRPVIMRILLATALLQVLGLAVPFFMQSIVDHALVNQNHRLLMVILWGMLAVFLMQALFLYVRNILLVHFRANFEMDFFSRFFRHFTSLKQAYYDANKREDFMYRFQENIKLRQLVNPGVIESIVDLAFVMIYIPVLILYNIKLGLIALTFVAIYLVMSAWFTPRIISLVQKVYYRNVETLGAFLDTLLGMQTVKLLSVENHMFTQWKNKYRRALNISIDAEKKGIVLHTLQRSIYYISHIVVLWVGAYMTLRQEITIGQYLAITAIFLVVINSLNSLSAIFYNLTELTVSLQRLNDVLVQKTEEKGLLDKVHSFPNSTIELRDVSFSYHPMQGDQVLHKINLVIKKGEHIGIAGRNGSGKTTLAKLLLYLYPQYEGDIRIGGLNIRDVNVSALRKKIFLFPQEVYLFNATILENIRFGNMNATTEDIIKAAELADLHEFIHQLHLGYNYKIGDIGASLSGGQRLKIGFARLFLSHPDVIILDEASSMLDVETERRIMMNVKKHFTEATIISIAHRMNTLRAADRIFVMEQGTIAEEGPHEKLMEVEDGIYAGFMKTYVSY
jgi:ABC-type bacteriocin/lantibiotic exporter with double-glycine peptidase domain